MKRSFLKNTALVTVLATTLTACGGGGGGSGAGVVLENTRAVVSSLNHSMFNRTGGSGTVASNDTFSSAVETLYKISSSYEIQNTDKEDAQLVVEFFEVWESFNSDLASMKTSTTGRETFDTYMNHTFPDNAETRAAGLAGKTWRDAHKMIHGAYLLLAPHKDLITRYANGDKIYQDESAYLNFVNDNELAKFDKYTDAEIENHLITKANDDSNLTNYNDDALSTKNISELDTINNIVDNAVSTINSLNSSISSAISANLSSVSAIVNYHDVKKSKTIITSVESGITIFEQILNDLENSNLTTKQKLDFYKSDDFKTAYKSYLYLKNDVKPIINKIKNAGTDQVFLDKTEVNTLAIDGKDNYTSNLESFLNPKLTTLEAQYEAEGITTIQKSETTVKDPVDYAGATAVGYSTWTTIYQGGGDEQRTKTSTTQWFRKVETEKCTWTQETDRDGNVTNKNKVCSIIETKTTQLPNVILEETETREGDNPVVNTVELDSTITESTEESSEYTETTYTDAADTTTETQEGSSITDTANRDVTTTTDHGDNTSTVVVTRYVDTTVTTPITTLVYRTRHYTDTVKKDTRTITTTTPVNRLTYKDGTTEDVNGTAVVVTGDWSTQTVRQSQRSENILQSETTSNQVVTTSDAGTQLSSVTTSNAYSNNDTNLGTPTENMSSVVADHKTAEYNSNPGLNTIKAADAYARGWTGKGAVLGVIDTWQDTDHEKLDGKYLFYKDYDPYNGVVDETAQGHGTFVASIIAGKRDGDSLDENGRLTTGDYRWDGTLTKNNDMHGVAFDAKLVGANVDRYSRGSIDKGQAQNALHDFAKLKSPESEGGEEMNIVAVNMSFNTPHLFYDNNGSTVTELADGTYNAGEIISKIQANGAGDARYWKVATDNDIILVNSAGNYGFAHAGDPGIWAVEEDSNGNLVLGGKMVIVGNWDGSSVSGNKAGHVCLNINTANNTCNDTHRLSEFYILAPGTNVMGAITDDRYIAGSGTSFAAPHVTGAFGVLNQMWPYMKGENLVKLVMNTADKNLPNYNVNIHGQGLLDLNEATKPQGAVGIVTTGRVDHPTVSLNNTYYSTGTALPSSLQNLRIMVLDDYDRNYYMDIGSTFVVKDKRKHSDVENLVANNHTFLPMNQMYGSYAQGGQWDLVKNYNFGFYTGENGNGDYSANVGKSFFITDKFKLKTNVGTMSEQETWLGNSSDGVLAVGDNNNTKFGNIGVDYQIGNNVLSLDYSRGKTDINTVDNSLIKSFSDVQTESYRLAYEIHKDKHNTLGWSFSLPSHITSGTMDLEVAESVNLDGTINYTNITSDLTQNTKEKNIGFYFNHTPTHDTDASFNFTAEYRQDIAGQSGNDGVNLGMNYVKKFWGSCKFLWMKNPKCYTKDTDGKEVLTADMQKLMYGHNNTDTAIQHGLRYDLKTDKFVPVDPEDPKWKR